MQLSNAVRSVWPNIFNKPSEDAFSYPVWTSQDMGVTSWETCHAIEVNEWRAWLLRVSGNDLGKFSLFLKSSATDVLLLLNNRMEDHRALEHKRLE